MERRTQEVEEWSEDIVPPPGLWNPDPYDDPPPPDQPDAGKYDKDDELRSDDPPEPGLVDPGEMPRPST